MDRDGVINKQAALHDYIKTWDEFEFLPGVARDIRRLNEAGYLVLIVSNQRGIARGMMTQQRVDEINRRMCAELEKEGAHIDKIYVCPHDYGQCNCRKPGIGLFLQAEQDYPIDKTASWTVGDSDIDVEAGARYGTRTIMTAKLSGAVDTILCDDRETDE